jgi:Stress responsive A/B Barrel Domain
MGFFIRALVILGIATGAFALAANAQNDGGKIQSPKLRHFVAFEFKSTTSAADVDKVIASFRELQKTVPQVQSIESGVNISPEHLNKGLTHAFFVTFANEKDRDIYLTHPEHEKFKVLIKPLVADVLVMDFWGG